MSDPTRAEPAPGNPHVARLVAPNPGPMTLGGTNTYLVNEEDGDGVWVVDPGPRIGAHLDTIRSAAAEWGGIRGVLLTHSHSDHSEAAADLGVPILVGAVSDSDEGRVFSGEPAGDGGERASASRVGGLEVIPTPGHAADHVVFVAGPICLCGDLVLGEGSTIVPPRSHGGSLTDYFESLDRLAAIGAELLAPGHGPWITDPISKIDQYRAHRTEREHKLLAALDAGERDRERLLDLAWDDVPELMRPAAAVALEAHLEKLADERRLPHNF